MAQLKFSSFGEVRDFIANKERTEYVQFFISSSRTIAGARKKGVKREIENCLKYYEIVYRCLHSGLLRSRTRGIRPNQKTFRNNCPFKLRLQVSRDGKSLIASELNDSHNHSHTKEIFSLLPRQRKLDKPIEELTRQMLRLRANKMNKKLIQAQLLYSTNTALKDIHNPAAKDTKDILKTTLKYIIDKENNEGDLCEASSDTDESEVQVHTVLEQQITPEQQKFSMVQYKIQQLASLVLDAPSSSYPQRLHLIDTLINLWENDKEAAVVPSIDDFDLCAGDFLQEIEVEAERSSTEAAVHGYYPVYIANSEEEIEDGECQEVDLLSPALSQCHLIDHDYIDNSRDPMPEVVPCERPRVKVEAIRSKDLGILNLHTTNHKRKRSTEQD